MSDTRFTHTDNDGDTLAVNAGVLGAVVAIKCEPAGFEGNVAVRHEQLPSLIAALQGILAESSHGLLATSSMHGGALDYPRNDGGEA